MCHLTDEAGKPLFDIQAVTIQLGGMARASPSQTSRNPPPANPKKPFPLTLTGVQPNQTWSNLIKPHSTIRRSLTLTENALKLCLSVSFVAPKTTTESDPIKLDQTIRRAQALAGLMLSKKPNDLAATPQTLHFIQLTFNHFRHF